GWWAFLNPVVAGAAYRNSGARAAQVRGIMRSFAVDRRTLLMSIRVTAVYQNGVLRPTQPLPLAEGETVEITLARPALTEAPPMEDEIDRRIRTAKTLEELFAAADAAAGLEPDDGYDLLQALDENRRLAGDARKLFPPEMKGISW